MTARPVSMPKQALLSIIEMPRSFRIAIPAFRTAPLPEPVPVETGLSKQEILQLFAGELNAARLPRLTEGEERERELASRIRGALYPGQGG